MAVVTNSPRVCLHCGASVPAAMGGSDFCCAGCQFVHDLIVKSGLGQFYDLQDATLPPAPSTVFQPRDYAWLETLAEANPDVPLELDLQGVSCVGCVWLIERLFRRHPGALSIRIDTTAGRLILRTGAGFDPAGFARELQSFGYLVGPPGTNTRPASQNLILRLGLCAALAMNAMLFTLPSYLGMQPGQAFASLFGNLAFACGTLSFAIGGSYFIRRAWQTVSRGILHIDLPIALGLVAAWSGSVIAWRSKQAGFVYFDFVSMFTFLMIAGRWLQQKAAESNRARLLSTGPDLARPDSGERYRIAPGATIPVRSLLMSRQADVSLEWINGESEAHTAHVGEAITAGAINLTADHIELEALEPWSESLLSRLVDHTQREQARDLRLERFLRTYLVIVLTFGALAFAAWLITTGDVLRALQVLTSILVVSCPCAAGVAIPLADDLAAAQVQRFGVFVRASTIWQRLARVRQIVFDKTGTLTLQGMELQHPNTLEALNSEQSGILLGLVRQALHPVASALREALMARGVCAAIFDEMVTEHAGLGLEVRRGEHTWRLGRGSWIDARGGAECVFACDDEVHGEFHFAESLRGEAASAVREFERRDVSVRILSGDRPDKVARIAAMVGLPSWAGLGGLTPDEKAAWLRAHHGDRTLMIGDGANDSLAFDEALCSGTPAIDRGVLEHKADFYFLGRSLGGIRALLVAAEGRARAVRRVITFAVSYNAIVLGISAAGHMSPLMAAVLMPLSSLATIGIVLLTLRTGMDYGAVERSTDDPGTIFQEPAEVSAPFDSKVLAKRT